MAAMEHANEPIMKPEQIREILASEGGSFALIEMVRAGKIDAETAVTAIDQFEKEPFWRRVYFALLDTLFSK